jgi:hypothetical protein
MKINNKIISLFTVLSLIILSCCSGNPTTSAISQTVTPDITTTIPSTETPIITPTAVENPNFPGLEPITPENINRLEIVDQLGVGQIYDVAISPDQSTLAVYTPMEIYLYDTATLTKTGEIGLEYSNNRKRNLTGSIVFSADGKNLYYSSQQTIIRLNIATRDSNYFFSQIPDWDISNIEITPDNEHFIITTEGGYSPCDAAGINYALYDFYGNLLFNSYSCTSKTITFYKIINNRLIIISSSEMTSVYPLEVRVVNIKDGFLLASSFQNYANGNGYFKSLAGNKDYLPSNDQLATWKDEFISKQNNQSNLPCNKKQNGYLNYSLIFQNNFKVLFLVADNQFNTKLELYNLPDCTLKNTLIYPMANQMIYDPIY